MFVQRLNAEGVPEWVVFEDGDGNGKKDGNDDAPALPTAATAVADALAGSLYADMLHDRPRAAAYAAALAATVKPHALVLDIGTGTGLLAALAARAQPTATVIACDQFPPMARLARETVAAAGLADRITVHACRSDELVVGVGDGGGRALPRRADVVVSEILDSILLGEGALPTAVDVGRRLLAPGGVAIPARGRVLAQALACRPLRACWDASAWAGRAAPGCGLGDDPAPRPLVLDALGASLVPAGPPTIILDDLDLTAPTTVEGRARARLPLFPAGTAETTVDALAVWWEVDLTPDGAVTLDTAPGWVRRDRGQAAQTWIDHWKACWVPGVPAAAAGEAPRAEGLEVEVAYGAADLAVRLVAGGGGSADAPPPPPPPPSPPPVSLAACYGPSGLGLWASSLRASALEAAAGGRATPTTRVITLGDGPLPALAAVGAGAAAVTALVTSSPAAAAAVGRVLGELGPSVRVTGAAPPPPPAATTPSPPSHVLVLAEPHYRAAEGRPLEALCRFIRDRHALEVAGSLGQGGASAPAITTCPARARVVVVGVAVPDLARTARPVRKVEGVPMAPFDAAVAGGCDGDPPPGKWLARPVGWQCGAYQEVTGRAGLGGGLAAGLGDLGSARLAPTSTLAGDATLTLLPANPTAPPAIDALAFWVEYGYGAVEDSGFEAGPTAPAGLTGGPAPGTQAVWLLAAPARAVGGELGVCLTLDVVADPDLGGWVDVRAHAEIV
jgi:predicted O-methyltransferase YrrM